MKPPVVIFDIYHTLLKVGPAPTHLAERWAEAWQQAGLACPPLSLSDFDQRCRQTVTTIRMKARTQGIAFPEVDWAAIARSVAPALAQLSAPALDDFLFAHARLSRTTHLARGAEQVLHRLAGRARLGLCTNCQPYSLRELAAGLAEAGLTLGHFESALCFFSFQAGFSKPSPAVFEFLQHTLTRDRIAPAEILMVGDRLDNDILPAQAHGWQTWHLAADSPQPQGGDWPRLLHFLELHDAESPQQPWSIRELEETSSLPPAKAAALSSQANSAPGRP